MTGECCPNRVGTLRNVKESRQQRKKNEPILCVLQQHLATGPRKKKAEKRRAMNEKERKAEKTAEKKEKKKAERRRAMNGPISG